MNQLQLVVARDGVRPPDVGRARSAMRDEADEDDGYWAGFRELLIVIDGVTELDRWDGMGLDPDDLLNAALPLVPPADGTPVDRVVQRCSCGEVGCSSLTMTIRRRGAVVEWTDARDRGGRCDIGPFVFDADAYEHEVRRAHRDRPWERRDERIARLVGEAMADLRGGRPRSFDWSSGGWSGGGVVVSVTDVRPNPRAGEPMGPPPRRVAGLRAGRATRAARGTVPHPRRRRRRRRRGGNRAADPRDRPPHVAATGGVQKLLTTAVRTSLIVEGLLAS